MQQFGVGEGVLRPDYGHGLRAGMPVPILSGCHPGDNNKSDYLVSPVFWKDHISLTKLLKYVYIYVLI